VNWAKAFLLLSVASCCVLSNWFFFTPSIATKFQLVLNTDLRDIRAGALGHAYQAAVWEATIFGAACFTKYFTFGSLLHGNSNLMNFCLYRDHQLAEI
jgi:hypothetical protein